MVLQYGTAVVSCNGAVLLLYNTHVYGQEQMRTPNNAGHNFSFVYCAAGIHKETTANSTLRIAAGDSSHESTHSSSNALSNT